MSQKKIHARGFNESVDESRAARVSFKRYLRELEEQSIDTADVFEADDQKLPEGEDAVNSMIDAFFSENDDLVQDARYKDTAEDGVEFLMDELERWLELRGFTATEVEEWMEKNEDAVYDNFYNGLT